MKKITIVGLGPGNPDDLTLGALKALGGGNTIIRTQMHGVVPFLKEEGITFSSLDDLYESSDTFEEAYSAMVERIVDKARATGEVVLGVPGHPMMGERLVLDLMTGLDRDEFELSIIPGVSRDGAATAAIVEKPSLEGLKILMAPELDTDKIDTDIATVVLDIDSPLTASEVKLHLLRAYPPELEVYICKNEEDGRIRYKRIALHEMDRLDEYDYTTCLYIPPVKLRDLEEFDFRDLVRVMDMLRSPDGCPWDREQTHESLRQYLLEETYEVLEAFDLKDTYKIIEELGDVLLQVVFHARIGSEHGEFDIRDITTGICRKMIDRHPHIFGDVKVEDSDQVLDNWEKIKKKEKGLGSHTQILKDIPPVLPALMRAYKVQKKAALVGFDWDRIEDALSKVREELLELEDAYRSGEQDKIDEELGDLLFSVVNVARFLKVEPELSLRATTEKFIRRFEYIEKMAPRPLEEMSLEDMDKLWNDAKMACFRDF
ncbi:MAG: nucleoside triphosphate pyrophosphohydrolase [Clostridiales bacterium]|nr:nucleoside triphosphate pyrophosphohydrolase [Clostridiales bacterium]